MLLFACDFWRDGEDAGLFSFSIVDREPGQENPVVDCCSICWNFLKVGRPTGVLDLIDSTIFRVKFELRTRIWRFFRDWILACHAHWGLNAEHRERLARLSRMSIPGDMLWIVWLWVFVRSNDEHFGTALCLLIKSKERMHMVW